MKIWLMCMSRHGHSSTMEAVLQQCVVIRLTSQSELGSSNHYVVNLENTYKEIAGKFRKTEVGESHRFVFFYFKK